ncbi:hypothetical protein U27_06594 [Candidatus Vecturithrix granuli]|uniref:Uncharacterized protein n=1 Tax=Vecturithrix granuli TaxID=1499967 RepID=A0A081C4V4_VECG1|nr:hypothetical protein U27_06594 [Candidatus Vecturithrix granuli]
MSNNQTFQVEAVSIQEAKDILKGKIPQGMVVISERVIFDGTEKLYGRGKTVDDAFQDAMSHALPDAEIIEKRTTSLPTTTRFEIKAFNDTDARIEAQQKIQPYSSIMNITVKIKGRKGFFGIGKDPNIYDVEVSHPAFVDITIRNKGTKAIIEAIVGFPKPPLPPKAEEMKKKWKAKAHQWWRSCNRSYCYCDDNSCLVDGENRDQSKRLNQGDGYIPLDSTRIYCEECTDRRLTRMFGT